MHPALQLRFVSFENECGFVLSIQSVGSMVEMEVDHFYLPFPV